MSPAQEKTAWPQATQSNVEKPLPPGWRWVRLGDVCEVNPRRPTIIRGDDTPTTFVPMTAVDAESGAVTKAEIRPYALIRKGYTYFGEGDVLFAKITPCMQNGKHAIARDLIDGIGFGTTEFHVFRPASLITAEWVHFFLRQAAVLELATTQFTGAVGQQRVPEAFLAQLPIPLPPLAEQKRIAGLLSEQMAQVQQARKALQEQLHPAAALPAACLREVFNSPQAQAWPRKRLGDVLRLRKQIIHPHDKPKGRTVFVGLEHIEPNSGRRIGSVDVEMSKLTGRKPQFRQGDIVYGYLRPYLNKIWIADFDGLCSVDQFAFDVDNRLAQTGFIAWFMRSPVYLERSRINTTTGQLPRIGTGEVADVELGCPSLDEQRKVLKAIDSEMGEIMSVRHGLEYQLAALDHLPAALLRQAFSGELQ